MKEIIENIIQLSGIERGQKGQTPDGLCLQGIAVLLRQQLDSRFFDEMGPSIDGMERDLMLDMEQFHEKFGLPPLDPDDLDPEVIRFRIKAMREEIKEFKDAKSREAQLDALIDLVYFALGTAYLLGFDFYKGWKEVHRANMTKERAKTASDSKRGSQFDVVKPKGWEPPNLQDCV